MFQISLSSQEELVEALKVSKIYIDHIPYQCQLNLQNIEINRFLTHF